MKTHIEKTVSHTPGPWEIQIRKWGLGCLPGGGILEIVHNYPDGGGQQIIVGEHTGIDCLNPANARLIASAPALLDTLRKIAAYIPCDTDYYKHCGALQTAARAAIAAATGKGEA